MKTFLPQVFSLFVCAFFGAITSHAQTQTFYPDPQDAHPPELILPDRQAFEQSATFTNLPAFTSLSVSFDISHPAPGEYLQVTIFPGRLAPITSRPPPGVPVFVLFDRERLVNATGQPVTRFQSVVALPQSVNGQPFFGYNTYTVQVLNDTYKGATNNVGKFIACSLTINPVNPGHAGPPVLSLSRAREDRPLPPTVNINYGDSLVLLATAAANPSSSYKIDRLGIVISPSPSPSPSPPPCPSPTPPPSPSPSPSPSPPPYRSNVVFQVTPSNSGAAVSFSPPLLAPGDYRIVATALDSAGFAQISSANLKVNRLLGIFDVSLLCRTVNCNNPGTPPYNTCTVDFRADITLRNMTQNTSGNLRIRLVSVPSVTFCDADGPPPNFDDNFPPTDLGPAYAVNPITPGEITPPVNVMGQVRAPLGVAGGGSQGGDCFNTVNFDIFAVLEELVEGQWVSVDSAKVTEGVHRLLRGFTGPGGGVNNPPPGLGGGFSPYVLASVAVTGPDPVNDSLPPRSYVATATLRNSYNNTLTSVVTTSSHWSVSPSPPFFIGSSNGVLQSTTISSARPATIRAVYTRNGVTKTGSKTVQVTP